MIIVKINGVQVSSAIRFASMSPWTSSLKYRQHEIDGANYDIVHTMGRNSATCSLTGICSRTAANLAILENMKGKVLSVESTVDGTRSGICLSLTPASVSEIYLTFTAHLMAV